MATIVPFVIRPRAAMPAPEGSATIIIFPGVRYEYRQDGDTASTPPQAAGVGRRGRKEKAR